MEQTPQSVILYDRPGRRQVNTDLKNVQQQVYSGAPGPQALDGCSVAVPCDVNASRLLLTMAQQRGALIATDVHAISDLADACHRGFLRYADVLFMIDELLPYPREVRARAVFDRFSPEALVIGLGGRGAPLAIRGDLCLRRIPGVHTREVVSTVGAGDVLFSAFVHLYSRSSDAYSAIRHAEVFAPSRIDETAVG